MMNYKIIGKYIKDFREGKGMPQRAKITALSMMTIFVLLAVLPFSPIAIPNNTMRIIVLAVGMIGFYYVSFRVPTKKD